MGTYKGLWRLWQPPADSLEAIAAVLGDHWRAATAHSEQLFWATPVSWLTEQARRVGAKRITR